ncbi:MULTISPECIES: exonuclease domain-containing protein [Actinosynnema]|uniref:exonuclease domain-containing protein n=1 Tax=Actinosynnema TaxID=40566 RepID=UPI0020A44D66|nr:exonuclease domain-containing protein [Actinosynnema pretiosum]MCP2096179.1 DNA polymerase-3 subunit epsilon [Actinosynnema pretiosum]
MRSPASTGSWADGPLLALDLETTDVEPRRDRIVTASVVVITPGAEGARPDVEVRTWLADPGVPIPASATAIHGISTEQARAEGRPVGEVVAEVEALLGELWTPSTPLCAFNAPFDLTMLDAELLRHHGRSLRVSGPVVDPLCVDRALDRQRVGKRTLGAVCEHHGVRLEGAHTSAGDALAAARLAWKLARVHPVEMGGIPLAELHERQVGWFREQELVYAAGVDRRIELAVAEGRDSSWLRRRAAAVRRNAESWPVLPEQEK